MPAALGLSPLLRRCSPGTALEQEAAEAAARTAREPAHPPSLPARCGARLLGGRSQLPLPVLRSHKAAPVYP